MDKLLKDGPHFLEQPKLPCPGDGSSLIEDPSHWASREEADGFDWSDAAVDEGPSLK